MRRRTRPAHRLRRNNALVDSSLYNAYDQFSHGAALPNFLVLPIISALFVTALCSQKHAFFLLAFVVPIFLIWALVMTIKASQSPAERLPFVFISLIWVAAIGITFGIHLVRFKKTRERANIIAYQIIEYRSSHGEFPEGPAITISNKEVAYFLRNQKPCLMYFSPLLPFSVYTYDFESKSWIFHAD